MADLVGSTLNDGSMRSGWQGGIDSGLVNPLIQEVYDTEVQRRIVEESNYRSTINWRPGVDTFKRKAMAGAKVEKLERSVIPGSHTPIWDEYSFTVDTAIIARTPVAKIDTKLFSDSNFMSEVGREHATELKEFFEPLPLLFAIKAAQVSAKVPETDARGIPTGVYDHNGGWWDLATGTWRTGWTSQERVVPPGFKGGVTLEFAAAGDELKWDKIEGLILDMCKKLRLQNLDPESGALHMDPVQYYALMRNDRFAATTFTRPSTVTEMGHVLKVNGIEVKVTNRMPDAENIWVSGDDHHILSNARNGNMYDTSLQDALACIVWYSHDAVLGLDLINHESSVWYNNLDHTWYIDDIQAYGLGVDRIHCAGAIFKNKSVYSTKALLLTAQNAAR